MNIKAVAFEAAQEMARQQGLQISTGQMMLVLGAFLEAGDRELADLEAETGDVISADPDHAERMRTYSGYSTLVSIRAKIALVESATAALPPEEDDWQYKALFDSLFEGRNSLSDEVGTVLKEMDRNFPDYYDPDTTYKEDSEAYIRALDGLIEDLRKEISGEMTEEDPYGYR